MNFKWIFNVLGDLCERGMHAKGISHHFGDFEFCVTFQSSTKLFTQNFCSTLSKFSYRQRDLFLMFSNLSEKVKCLKRYIRSNINARFKWYHFVDTDRVNMKENIQYFGYDKHFIPSKTLNVAQYPVIKWIFDYKIDRSCNQFDFAQRFYLWKFHIYQDCQMHYPARCILDLRFG